MYCVHLEAVPLTNQENLFWFPYTVIYLHIQCTSKKAYRKRVGNPIHECITGNTTENIWKSERERGRGWKTGQ